MSPEELEAAACTPLPIAPDCFNPSAQLPYGMTSESIRRAMAEFLEFLGFINVQLATRRLPRLESFLMPANFSSMVGEFMGATIPKHCPSIARNHYHNGHPDLVPTGVYPGDSILHGDEGVEIKASRYLKGWQGHNPEDVWLMVFVFAANASRDESLGIPPLSFRFLKVVGAKLLKRDWNFSGRSPTSRRTATASITSSGFDKMEANWIYRSPQAHSARLEVTE